jgi:hypothetical protein
MKEYYENDNTYLTTASSFSVTTMRGTKHGSISKRLTTEDVQRIQEAV